jgi:hypothetical protein
MVRGKDGNGSLYISWEQPGGFKRAWVQHRTGDRDWAKTGRYVNVVRTDTLEGGPSGSATDFPIYNDLPDGQVLEAFVAAICAVTGCELPETAYPSN